jgi:hypothetical protein
MKKEFFKSGAGIMPSPGTKQNSATHLPYQMRVAPLKPLSLYSRPLSCGEPERIVNYGNSLRKKSPLSFTVRKTMDEELSK